MVAGGCGCPLPRSNLVGGLEPVDRASTALWDSGVAKHRWTLNGRAGPGSTLDDMAGEVEG